MVQRYVLLAALLTLSTFCDATFAPGRIEFFRDVLAQAGITNAKTITICRTDGFPFTAGILFNGSLAINETELSSLPLEQQTFVLLHEAAHVHHKHLLKRIIVDLCALLPLQFYLQTLLYVNYPHLVGLVKNQQLKKILSHSAALSTAQTVLSIATFLIPLMAFCYNQELAANNFAVTKQQTAAPALDWYDTIIDNTPSFSEIRNMSLWEKIDYVASTLFTRLTHGSPKWEQNKLYEYAVKNNIPVQ